MKDKINGVEKRKILYANLNTVSSFRGHKMADCKWLESFSRFGKTDVFCPSVDWYDNLPLQIGCCIYPLLEREYGKSKLNLRNHILTIQFFIKFWRYVKTGNYTHVIISTYDIVTFPLLRFFIKDKYIFVIEHNMGRYEKKSLRPFFNLIKNKVNHIVMEQIAISRYQELYHLNVNNVFYIPHPLNIPDAILRKDFDMYDVVGISNSNSKDEVLKIVEYEKETRFFKSNKISVLLRTKDFEYDNGYLKVVAGEVHFSFEEYYSYIVRSKIVLLPFDKNFGVRSSGTIADALSNHVPIIGTEFETLRGYVTNYPNICQIYSTPEVLVEKIKGLLKEEERTKEFNLFMHDKSETMRLALINKMFHKIDDNMEDSYEKKKSDI